VVVSETRTVVFQYLDASGLPVSGYLTFTPTVTLVDSATDQFTSLLPVVVTLDATGSGSVVLTCTDDPAYAPTGWSWAVSELIPGGRNRDNTYFVTLSTTQPATVGLADLPGATPVAFSMGSTSSTPSLHDTWYGDVLPAAGERVPPYLWAPSAGTLYLVTADVVASDVYADVYADVY
jgi:hypothetical protein